ncbi:ankyrin repeat domain-containing protein [Amycolatopsis rubida]|uniref:Ankyrin repeat-containing protein n=1 Tax=Amycolatopsis rubida TaxID=112413 RepID=A0A1I5E5C6_9PSEU|nr:ankyrin repeat domain-containing protein [Amycolatopsis rubida]SFO06513.1 Ankyrin repeat-containing protein [Amycolatopsis rubida]
MSELDREGRDELHYAAKANDVDTLRRRLDAGVAVDLVEQRARWTPLFFAVDNGAVDAAEALLDAGADIEARADREITPLHLAVNRWRQSPDGAMIRLLLDRGADKASADMHGWTPGDRAKGQFGFPDDLKELLAP